MLVKKERKKEWVERHGVDDGKIKMMVRGEL